MNDNFFKLQKYYGQIEIVLRKEKGMRLKLAKFCYLITLSQQPETDSGLADMSIMARANWKAKDVATLRHELIEWQKTNGEYFEIKTSDGIRYSYKITTKLDELIKQRLEKMETKD